MQLWIQICNNSNFWRGLNCVCVTLKNSWRVTATSLQTEPLLIRQGLPFKAYRRPAVSRAALTTGNPCLVVALLPSQLLLCSKPIGLGDLEDLLITASVYRICIYIYNHCTLKSQSLEDRGSLPALAGLQWSICDDFSTLCECKKVFAANPRFARGESRISFDMLKSLRRV